MPRNEKLAGYTPEAVAKLYNHWTFLESLLERMDPGGPGYANIEAQANEMADLLNIKIEYEDT